VAQNSTHPDPRRSQYPVPWSVLQRLLANPEHVEGVDELRQHLERNFPNMKWSD
jgi:hypothetical protein